MDRGVKAEAVRAPLPVLALNAGSSSLKFGVHLVDAAGARLLAAGEAQAPLAEPDEALAQVAAWMASHSLPAPAAVGHRIVHGGVHCREHLRIDADADAMRRLEAAAAFAPLHVPRALALLRAAQARFPQAVQVACLDTAFHAGMPEVARTLPLPLALRARGLHRYGFHGLSCESIVRQFGDALPRRLVIAHLGHGASVTAVAEGRSIDTSMGLTPSGGVVMSTRCGDLDPGVLVYLVRELGYDAERLEALVDRQSGLLGLSGLDDDLRVLHAAAPDDAHAQLAIDAFCHSIRKHVAAMAATLGGLDALVFTGGIGENDAAVRAVVVGGLEALRGGFSVHVMPAREDERIAWHAWRLATTA